MEASGVAVGVIFLSQTTFGVLGNCCLVYRYLFLFFRKSRLKFTDWILMHLIVAKFLTVLCKGVSQTVAALGLKYFLNDFGCKLLFFFHRLGRGVSITSTCFLSVFQAITLSPPLSFWAKFKVKTPSNIASFIYMSWILFFTLNIEFLMSMTGIWNQKNITNSRVFEYCYSANHSEIRKILFTVYLTINDTFFLGLMLWASSNMVCILFRHKHSMKDVHRSNFSLRSSPEARATKTILLLVSTFIFFYTISRILQSCLALLSTPGWLLVSAAAAVSGSFPAVSPFLLMSHELHKAPLCIACARNRKT